LDFLVGKDRTRLTAHRGVLQNLSEPMNDLVNTGQVDENGLPIALEIGDVEVDTFIGFCEHVYTGEYVTPGYEAGEVEGGSLGSIVKGNTLVIDKEPGVEFRQQETYDLPMPEEAPAEEVAPADDWGFSSKKNKKKKARSGWSPVEEPVATVEEPWNVFRALHFGDKGASVCPVSSDPDLLFHAKLYVFATRFLIETLRVQCLTSLHRDLCSFPLNKGSAPRILDLLEFTYTNTTRKEPGGTSRLRDLVIHYVACKTQTLADNGAFYVHLDGHGEMGSDLVAKLVKYM
jgi:hypothetical protein